MPGGGLIPALTAVGQPVQQRRAVMSISYQYSPDRQHPPDSGGEDGQAYLHAGPYEFLLWFCGLSLTL